MRRKRHPGNFQLVKLNKFNISIYGASRKPVFDEDGIADTHEICNCFTEEEAERVRDALELLFDKETNEPEYVKQQAMEKKKDVDSAIQTND